MPKTIVYVALLVGGIAFLGMLKLLYDMTGHMERMTDHVAVMSTDMGRMRGQMETLVQQVSGIQASVQYMVPLAEDVHGLRESVGSMAGVIHRSGEQIKQLNPLDAIQQMMPPGQRR